jgi:hypothetical protein
MGSPLRASRLVLAGGVLLVAAITFSGLPQPYPTWPTVGSIPVNPELVVPGLLGLAAVLGSLRAGIGVGSIAIGTLGVVTLWVAATSLYDLYAGTGGGVFWGGFVTLLVGVVLAVGVVLQELLGRSGHCGAVRRLREWLGA